jgi:hypothetical protein
MLNVHFGWRRLARLHVTQGYIRESVHTVWTKSLSQVWLCRLDFHLAIPVVSLLLWGSLLVKDLRGYSASLLG